MAIPANMARLTFHFDLRVAGVTQDIAEFSWWVQPATGAPDDGDWDVWLGILAQLAADSWSENADKATWSSAVVFTKCIAVHPAADGSTLNRQERTPAAAWAGSGGEDSLPWETALAVSIYTYTPGTFIERGRTRRGRFYLPPFQVGILNDSPQGQIPDGTAQGIMSTMRTIFLRISDGSAGDLAPGPGWQVDGPILGVMSKERTQFFPITDWRIDTKIDSQRRRQNRQPARVFTLQA